MKSWSPGPSADPENEETRLSPRTKLSSFILKRYLLQVQASRPTCPKVFRRKISNPLPNLNSQKNISLFGSKVTQNDAVPLDLSFTTGIARPQPQASNPPPSKPLKAPKEITWKPLVKSPPQVPPRKREWFPVTKLTPQLTNPEPKFFPVPRNRRITRSQGPYFRWTNSLNYIFLQERQTPEEEQQSTAEKDCSLNADPKTPDSTSSGSSQASSRYEKPAVVGPSLKPPAPNPFKITPSHTWPIDSTEHQNKPILAPPKFGTNVNSGFGKLGSNTGGVGGGPPLPKPGGFGPLNPPTLSVTSPSENPKPTFKLKPPVLGGHTAVSSSSFSVKRPAAKAENEGVADSSSPLKLGSGASSESPPEAKRLRTTPSDVKDNGSNVSSSSSSLLSSSEDKRSTSPSSTSSSSSSSSSSSAPFRGLESSSLTSTSTNVSVPTFVPLSSTNMDATSSEDSCTRMNGVGSVGASSPPLSSKVSSTPFIFGQNLENRVTGVSSTSSGTTSIMRFSNGETNPSTSGTGLNLFTAAANSLATPLSTSEGGKSLSESSREFSLKEERLKTKYEEVQIITGEEGEKNVIQMNCKLYSWSNASWQERGRGILRLNDREIRDELHSRLVIRTQGTLTVMLNAKIWAEMSIEKPNDKSVRFTASDADGQPRIYLVMGSPKDITLLHNSLEYRVAAARSQTLDEKDREADHLSDDNIPALSV